MRIRKIILGLCSIMMFSGAIVASQGASTVAMAKGLEKPIVLKVIDAGGRKDGIRNSTKELQVEIRSNCKKKNIGYKLYRRLKGTKKWKLVKTGKKKGWIKIGKKKKKGWIYTDKKVKAGKVYQYKAKVFYKTKKKTVYSKFSNIQEIGTYNYDGKYSVQLLGIDSGEKEISFSIKSHKHNGTIIFYKSEEARWTEMKSEEINIFTLTQSRLVNKTWIDIPKNGIKLKKGKKIYLKGVVTESDIINFDDTNFEEVLIGFGDGDTKYLGNQEGHNIFTINFKEGTGYCRFM